MFRKRHILWCGFGVVVLTCLTFVFVIARIRSSPTSQGPAGATLQSPRKPETGKQTERIEMVQITVRPTGPEPSELALSSNKFLLAIDNQSGAGDLALQLIEEDEHGNARGKLRDFGLSLELLNKRQVTHLPPGRYVLREVNRPEWACHITINQN